MPSSRSATAAAASTRPCPTSIVGSATQTEASARTAAMPRPIPSACACTGNADGTPQGLRPPHRWAWLRAPSSRACPPGRVARGERASGAARPHDGAALPLRRVACARAVAAGLAGARRARARDRLVRAVLRLLPSTSTRRRLAAVSTANPRGAQFGCQQGESSRSERFARSPRTLKLHAARGFPHVHKAAVAPAPPAAEISLRSIESDSEPQSTDGLAAVGRSVGRWRAIERPKPTAPSRNRIPNGWVSHAA